jgi:hypothetical protein
MTQSLHHANAREVAPGLWQVAKPLRDTSPLHRWNRERACLKSLGHCWHPEDMIGWYCCECGGDTEGTPEQWCVHCS